MISASILLGSPPTSSFLCSGGALQLHDSGFDIFELDRFGRLVNVNDDFGARTLVDGGGV